MQKIVLLLALFLVGYLIYHLYLKKAKNLSREQLIKYAIVGAGIFLLIMAATGRASAIFAAIGALMTFAMRYYPIVLRYLPEIRKAYRSFSGKAASANQSRVSTAVFTMTLDHDSGHMDGEITDGSFAGKHLSELSIAELEAFYRFCQTRDQQAVQVLHAYIQRERADEWQNEQHYEETHTAASTQKTSVEEAWEILGLEPGASKKAIIDAHRRLMSRMHPDKGGSNYLASKINKAKEILLTKVA